MCGRYQLAVDRLTRAKRVVRVATLVFGIGILFLCRMASAVPVGTIFSGPTAADPNSVYWNPAAMMLLSGTQGQLFTRVAFISLNYRPDTISPIDGLPDPEASTLVIGPKPSAAVVTDASLEKFRFGISAQFPAVDGTAWDRQYPGANGLMRPSLTRYYSISSRQIIFSGGPAVAYRPLKFLSIGFGIEAIGIWLNHNWTIDLGAKVNQLACRGVGSSQCDLNGPLPRQDSAWDVELDISGNGWAVGISAGALLSFDWIRVGMAIHSGAFGKVTVPIRLSGGLPPSLTQFVETNLPQVRLPQLQAEAEVFATAPLTMMGGVTIIPLPDLELTFDMRWQQTSDKSVLIAYITASESQLATDQTLIRPIDDDFWFSWRADYRFLSNLRGSFRVEFVTAARSSDVVTPVTFSLANLAFNVGVMWQATSWFALTAEVGQFVAFTRRIRSSLFAPNANPTTEEEEGLDKVSPTGEYSAMSTVVGLGVQFSY